MLRALVVLFLLVNGGLFWWLKSDPQALQPDREPQRLAHQVSPDAIRVLPDLPTSNSGPALAASAAAEAAPAASGANEADTGCAETPPLDGPAIATLTQSLIRAGVPADAIVERRVMQGGSWISYIGRFNDSNIRQQRANELDRLGVKFEPVNAPPALAPGLSLGKYTNKAEATQALEELIKRGVHGARLVTMTPPAVQRHLQVHATDPAWRGAVAGLTFESCPVGGN